MEDYLLEENQLHDEPNQPATDHRSNIKELNKKIKNLEADINIILSSLNIVRGFDFGENGDFQRLSETLKNFGKTFANDTFHVCTDCTSPTMIFKLLETAEISKAKNTNFGIEKQQYYYLLQDIFNYLKKNIKTEESFLGSVKKFLIGKRKSEQLLEHLKDLSESLKNNMKYHHHHLVVDCRLVDEGVDEIISLVQEGKREEVRKIFFAVVLAISKNQEIYTIFNDLFPFACIQILLNIYLGQGLPFVFPWVTDVFINTEKDYSRLAHNIRKAMLLSGLKNFDFEFILVLHQLKVGNSDQWNNFWKKTVVTAIQHDWACEFYFRIFQNYLYLENTFSQLIDPQRSTHFHSYVSVLLQSSLERFLIFWKKHVIEFKMIQESDYIYWLEILCYNTVSYLKDSTAKQTVLGTLATTEILSFSEKTIKLIYEKTIQYGLEPIYLKALENHVKTEVSRKMLYSFKMSNAIAHFPSVISEEIFMKFLSYQMDINTNIADLIDRFISSNNMDFQKLLSFYTGWFNLTKDLKKCFKILNSKSIGQFISGLDDNTTENVTLSLSKLFTESSTRDSRLKSSSDIFRMAFGDIDKHHFVFYKAFINSLIDSNNMLERLKTSSLIADEMKQSPLYSTFATHLLENAILDREQINYKFLLESGQHLKIFIDTWKKFKDSGEWKNYCMLFMDQIHFPLMSLVERISENEISFKDLEFIVKEKKPLNLLLTRMDIPEIDDIEKKFKLSKSIMQDFEEISKIISWLKQFPLLMEFTQHLTLMDNTSMLFQLEQNLESLKAQLSSLDERKDLIIFLTDESSLLFHSLFKKFLYDVGEVSDADKVSEIFTQVINFLEHINEQTIQDLKEYEILDLSKQLRSKGKTLSGEIELLSKVLNNTKTGSKININLDVLRKALNLEELGTGLEYMVDCMNDYNMECTKEDSFCDIKLLKNQLSGLGDIPLAKVEGILGDSSTSLQGLEAYHMKYFKDLMSPESKGLIQFLKDNESSFEDSIKVVRTRSRNSKFHEEVVNSLIIAKELVSPFLHQKISFSDFRKKILALFNKEEDLFKLKDLQVVNENLTTVKILFSSTSTIHLDDVFDSVRTIIEKGKFISTPDSLLVSYEDKEISGEDLIDLVRVAIFRSSDSENDQNIKIKNDLQNFILLYQMAEQIQSTIKELIKEGYPKYNDQERVEINEKMEKAELERKNNLFNAKLEKWKKSINQLVETEPTILNLSRSQLTRFVSLFKESLQDEQKDCDNLLPYVMLMLKDLYRNELKYSPLNEEILKEILNEFAITRSAKEILELSGKFVQKIIETIGGDPDHEEQKGYETKTLYDVKPSLIPLVLLKIFKDNIVEYSNDDSVLIVNNSNIFYCDQSTRKEDIQWFCKRRKSFPELKYALVDVNKLILSVKEELVKFEYEHCEKNIKVGVTTLIFTSDTAREAFSFIQTNNEIEGSIENSRPILKKYMSTSCNISKFEIVKGDSASGKTRYIQSKREEDEAYVRVAVHEEFSYDYFFEQLSFCNFEDSNKVLIHFDISYVFELRNFELFILEWIFGRCLQSKKGQILNTWDLGAESIRIFVEIPSGFDKQKLDLIYCIETNTPTILRSDINSFDFGEEKTRYVSSMFNLYRTNKIGDINAFFNVDKDLLSEEKSKKILTEFFTTSKVTNNHALRKLFIELMYERFKGLENFHLNFLKMKDSDVNIDIYEGSRELLISINQTLFTVFRNECEIMTDNTIERCWSDLPVAFAVPCLDENIPSYDIVRCAGCSSRTGKYPGMRVLDVKSSTLEEIRSILSSSFQVRSIVEICERTNYLLTKDFAIKLFLLNERRKVGKSVILESQTGVGKSELLRFWAEVLNSNSKLLPDIRFELRKWLCDTIRPFTQKNNIQTEVDTEDIDKLRSREYIIKLMRETEEQVGNQPLSELITSLVTAVRGIFDQFKLLEKTEIINSTFEAISNQNFELLTVDVISDFLAQAEIARPENSIYYKILMHSGITSKEIRQTIRDIERNTNRLIESGYVDLKVVVFIDELNTSSCMGIMKELFVDHTLDGKLLPKSIFFVGAINPKLNNDEYVVNEIAPSMKLIRFNYSDLSKYQEQEFLALLIQLEQKKREQHEEALVNDLQAFILSSQRFVAESDKLDKRIRVSIRDLTRACKLYWFLKDNEILHTGNDLTYEQTHIICLYMALALSYYFRLPSSERKRFEKMIDEEAHTQVQYQIFNFAGVVSEQLGYFYNRARQLGFIPNGVAATKALLENFFTMVIGIQSVTPISLVGPPGNSKTLSYTIATQKKKNLFAGMKTVHTQHYQCNELSTANEIELVLKSQVETRRKYERAGMVNEICSVLIDEASLPIEKKNSLKVLHYYLDKPTISTVLISNTLLDAAKSNRAIQVAQPETTFDDLRALCQGCLMLQNEDIRPNSKIDRIITALCKSFKEVNSALESPLVKREKANNEKGSNIATEGIFHLRDFVYFLRMLKKNKGNHKDIFSGNNIYYCLQRNFNGVPESDFQKIQELFLKNINDEVGSKIHIDKKEVKNFMEIVYDSIHDSINLAHDDPNQSHYRHTMIIDPSQAQASIKLLSLNNIFDKSKTKIVYISDFKGDTNDLSLSQEISEVKHCMETGDVVVLVNSSAISTNFYDVFNKHFTNVNDKLFANVSIKGKTHPCEINPSFHCIVHVPISQYRDIPLPFLNRFEKYIIGAERILKRDLNEEKEESKKAIFDFIRKGVNDFIHQFDLSTFYGLVEQETLDSLIMSIYQHSNGKIQIKKPLTVKNNNMIQLMKENDVYDDSIDTEDDDGEEMSINKLKSYIRKINFQLLQIAKPEDIFLRRKFMPKSYLIEYLTRQEHFCTITFLKNAIDQHFKQTTASSSKQIIYTRHSSGIHTLPDSEPLKREITSSVFSSEQLQSCVNDPTEIITIASLSSFSSQLEFQRFLNDFASESQKLVLIFTVDMSMITRSIVNFVKFKIENMLLLPMKKVKNMVPFVSLILYFPPECSHFNPAYDSIFLEWDYFYIDSLRADLGDGEVSQFRDSRYWFSVAVGLLKGFSPSDRKAFQQAFNSLYDKLLGDYIHSNVSVMSAPSLFAYFNSKKIIRQQDKQKFIEDNLKKLELLRDIVLTMFSDRWNSQFLSNLIQRICTDITGGKIVNGIIQTISYELSSILEEMMFPITRKLMLLTPSVEKILNVKDNSTLNFLPKLIGLFITTSKKKNKSSGLLYASSHQSANENLPLSTLLIEKMILNEKSDQLDEVIDLIENDKENFEKFRLDMISFYFGKDIQKVDQAIRLIDILISPIWNTAEGKKSARLLSHLSQTKVKNSINILLCVLSKFKSIQFLTDDFKKHLQGKSLQESLELIFSFVIDTIYQKLCCALEEQDLEKISSCKSELENINFLYIKDIAPKYFKLPKFSMLFVIHSMLKDWECTEEQVEYLWRDVGTLLTNPKSLPENYIDICESFNGSVSTFLEPSKQGVWINNVTRFAFVDILDIWSVPSLNNFLITISCYEKKENKVWKHLNIGLITSITKTIMARYLQNKFNQNMLNLIEQELQEHSDGSFIPEEISSKKQPLLILLLQSAYQFHYSQTKWDSFLPIFTRHSEEANNTKLFTLIAHANNMLLLTKLSSFLLKDGSPQRTIESLDNDICKLISDVIKKEGMALFFLSRYTSDVDLEMVITANRGELGRIGLDQYHVPSIKKNYKSHHFSFMHDYNNHIYTNLKSLIQANNMQQLQQFINNNVAQQKYFIRMCLLVISYNFYFLECNSCNSVLALLQDRNILNVLSIEDCELKAFTFFATKPISLPVDKQDDCFIMYYFSEEFIRSNRDKMLTHLLANITATNLGVPKEKNHLYNRMFNPQVLANSYGPGSTYDDKNWDCGFTSSGFCINKIENHNIMNRNQTHHSALNALTWASFVMCVVFDGRNENAAKGGHMCNYVDEVRYKANLTSLEKLQTYIKIRADTFCSIFAHSPNIIGNVDPIIFFTSALEEFSTRSPNSNDCVGFFNQKGNVIRVYENFWMNSCFIPTLNQYGNIVAKMNTGQKLLQEISQFKERVTLTRKNVDYFPSRENIISLFSQKYADAPKTVQLVVKYKDWLAFSYCFVEFLDFYIRLHKGLNGKLEKDAIHMNVEESLKLITSDLSKQEKDNVYESWTKFKKSWKNLTEKKEKNLVACLADERDLPEISEESILSHLLFIEGGNNEIGRMLESVYLAQSEIQQDYSFDNIDAANVLELDDVFYKLLFTNFEEDTLFENIQNYLVIDNGEINFDWESLEHYFIESLSKGRPRVFIPNKGMVMTPQAICKFKEDMEFEPPIQEEETKQDVNLDSYASELNSLIDKMNTMDITWKQLENNKKNSLMNSLNFRDTKKILQLAKETCEAAINLVDKKPFKPFNMINSEKELLGFSEFVLDIIYNRDEVKSLYDKFSATFRIPMNHSTRDKFENITKTAMKMVEDPNNAELDNFVADLRTIATVIYNNEKDSVKAFSSASTTSLREIFENQIQVRNQHNLNIILPLHFPAKNLVAYIENVRRLIGKIELKKSSMRTQCYQELLPQNLKSRPESPIDPLDNLISEFEEPEEDEELPPLPPLNIGLPSIRPFNHLSIDQNQMDRVNQLLKQTRTERDQATFMQSQLLDSSLLLKLVELLDEADHLNSEGAKFSELISKNQALILRQFNKLNQK